MWRAVNADGSLVYTFIESVAAIHVYDWIRAAGGVLFLFGALIMFYNVVMTIRQGSARIPADLPAGAVPVAGGR
jgi:cytochrome c oxidase cbb3-type subunit 1